MEFTQNESTDKSGQDEPPKPRTIHLVNETLIIS